MWNGFVTYFLHVRLVQLEKNIRRLQRENVDLNNSAHVRLYVAAHKGMEQAQLDPTAREYMLGNTIGQKNRDWRRIKNLLPPRYRLFFKFFSQHKEVFFVWLNDENTLRHAGAKTDCYAYFKRLIDGNKIPSNREDLQQVSIPTDSPKKTT